MEHSIALVSPAPLPGSAMRQPACSPDRGWHEIIVTGRSPRVERPLAGPRPTDIDALASRVKAEFDTFDLLFVNAAIIGLVVDEIPRFVPQCGCFSKSTRAHA